MRRSLIVTTLQHVASVSGLSRIEGFDFDRADMRENKNFLLRYSEIVIHMCILDYCMPVHFI